MPRSSVFDSRVNTSETGLNSKIAKKFGQFFPEDRTITKIYKTACQYIQYLKTTNCELYEYLLLLRNTIDQDSLKLNCSDRYCNESERIFENITILLDYFLSCKRLVSLVNWSTNSNRQTLPFIYVACSAQKILRIWRSSRNILKRLIKIKIIVSTVFGTGSRRKHSWKISKTR